MGAKGRMSSVIAATVLRLLFCWASRVPGWSVGLPFAWLSPDHPRRDGISPAGLKTSKL